MKPFTNRHFEAIRSLFSMYQAICILSGEYFKLYYVVIFYEPLGG